MTKHILPIFALICLIPSMRAEDSSATKLLTERSEHLKPMITRVSPSVYCASGYSPANISMIVGSDGLVIVDTGMFPDHAKAVLKEFRKISDLRIKGIILTHGHGDHTGGASVFVEDEDESLPSTPDHRSTPKGGCFREGD